MGFGGVLLATGMDGALVTIMVWMDGLAPVVVCIPLIAWPHRLLWIRYEDGKLGMEEPERWMDGWID